MAAGFRSPLPLWFGVAAQPKAGYRSLLGFWFGVGIGSGSGTPLATTRHEIVKLVNLNKGMIRS